MVKTKNLGLRDDEVLDAVDGDPPEELSKLIDQQRTYFERPEIREAVPSVMEAVGKYAESMGVMLTHCDFNITDPELLIKSAGEHPREEEIQ